MDATFTPNYMSKRGVMLQNEFRYLTHSSGGQINYNILPSDNIYGDKRESVRWQHAGQQNRGWSTSADFNYVSDVDYLTDFGGNLSTTSVTHLDRKAQLNYNADWWQFTSLAQEYQTLSGTEPYKRLPQLTFSTRFPNPDNDFNYLVNAEYVRFDHRDANKLVGDRIKLMPSVSYPMSTSALFLTPKVTLHYLGYNLNNNPATQPDQPSVTVPVYSMDAGVFLERDTSIGGVPLLQTLEPRLFYVYAPYQDQSDLPVFDTALTTFSQSQLFSENRFSGNDRIGDANRLTVALTTRLLRQDSGAELLSATVGQIAYFADREVTLPGQPVQTDNRSDIIGLLSLQPLSSLRFNGDIQWDPDTRHTTVGNARLQFQPGEHTVMNLGYRFRREQLRAREVSFAWRVNPHWQLLGGQQYDLENDRNLESFFGVHYQSCCWGLRLMARERFDRLDDTTAEPLFEKAIYLELELKGLSGFGQSGKMDQIVQDGIPGYRP
jgi:LPS-assembly protein